MKFFLVNNETEAAISLMKKMAKHAKNGAIIPCTPEEMEAARGSIELVVPDSINSPLCQVYPGCSYLLFADQNINIEEVGAASERLGIEISVIRTKTAETDKDAAMWAEFQAQEAQKRQKQRL